MTDRIPPPMTGPASRTVAHEDEDWMEHMLVEICLGVEKQHSRNIHNAEQAETWDRLAADVADMKARGIAIEFDIRD